MAFSPVQPVAAAVVAAVIEVAVVDYESDAAAGKSLTIAAETQTLLDCCN